MTAPHAKLQYHHGNLKDELVSRALEILENRGLDHISLREISQELGVSKNAPYRHFETKNDLLTAVAARLATSFSKVIRDTADAHRPFSDLTKGLRALKSVSQSYLQFAIEHRAGYQLMFSSFGYSLHSETCAIETRKAFGVLIELVISCHTMGWRPGEDPAAKGYAIWAGLHGWANILQEKLLPEDFPPPDNSELIESIIKSV